MQIKVLQGLNLKNPFTTVVAVMDTVKPDLPDYISGIHPIFMKSYEIIDGKTLEVQTHLPFLWKYEGFLQPIEDFSTGKTDFETAKMKMLDHIRLTVRSMTTIPILEAAHELGYETYQFYLNEGIHRSLAFNRTFLIGIGKEQQQTFAAASTKDTPLSLKIQRDKGITNQVIEEMGLPIAAWAPVETREDIAEATKKVGFPCVLKPVGLTAGHGVHVGLNTVEEVEDAWDRTHDYFENDMKYPDAKSPWQKKIIIQRVLKGEDYRVLVINGKFEMATHRLQARVTGDGKSTVEQLINKENENPARDINLPTHTLKPIVIDKDLKNVLKRQDLSLDYVPKKDEVVRVRNVASMSQGGITADMTDVIHPSIKKICESIATTIHAYVLGVDVLCQDISKPLSLENGGIIEINTMPETYLNSFPVIGKQYPDIGMKIVKGLMEPDIHTNKVVVLGEMKPEEIRKKINENLKNIEKVGLYSEGTYYIDEIEINSGLSTNECVLCLKKNRSLHTIALQYKDLKEVEENGLGFDEIDLLVVAKNLKVPDIIPEYERKGLIKKLINS